ncbi:MAG: AsnC family protein, partial [Clostridia bacterium]|nr:AsnC family protein [Clostridia bacterium]
MDNFDNKILKVLQDDSRCTSGQVADMVGLD